MLVTIGLVTGSFLAWAGNTTASARAEMTLPTLTSLAVSGTADSGREGHVSVAIPATTITSSGHVELRKAVVLVVRSNVQWTLAVRPTDRSAYGIVEVRTGRGEYRPVGPEGLVLSQGGPGVHEIVLDYRVHLNDATGWNGGRWLTLAYAIEG